MATEWRGKTTLPGSPSDHHRRHPFRHFRHPKMDGRWMEEMAHSRGFLDEDGRRLATPSDHHRTHHHSGHFLHFWRWSVLEAVGEPPERCFRTSKGSKSAFPPQIYGQSRHFGPQVTLFFEVVAKILHRESLFLQRVAEIFHRESKVLKVVALLHDLF